MTNDDAMTNDDDKTRKQNTTTTTDNATQEKQDYTTLQDNKHSTKCNMKFHDQTRKTPSDYHQQDKRKTRDKNKTYKNKQGCNKLEIASWKLQARK